VTDEEITALEAELEATKKEVERLKAQLDERDAKMGELQTVIASQSEELASLREASAEATYKYRGSLLAANPEVPEEMIIGETIADIDASLETAKALVSKVKAKVEEEAKAAPVPAGAPERSGQDLSSMSPREKIEHALRAEGGK